MVGVGKPRRHPVLAAAVEAQFIPGLDVLHLDDFGTVGCEQVGGRRHGYHGPQLEHPGTLQWQAHRATLDLRHGVHLECYTQRSNFV